MAEHLDKVLTYISYTYYFKVVEVHLGLLVLNVRISHQVLLNCDNTIIKPDTSFIMVLNNHSQMAFILSPIAFLI